MALAFSLGFHIRIYFIAVCLLDHRKREPTVSQPAAERA